MLVYFKREFFFSSWIHVWKQMLLQLVLIFYQPISGHIVWLHYWIWLIWQHLWFQKEAKLKNAWLWMPPYSRFYLGFWNFSWLLLKPQIVVKCLHQLWWKMLRKPLKFWQISTKMNSFSICFMLPRFDNFQDLNFSLHIHTKTKVLQL